MNTKGMEFFEERLRAIGADELIPMARQALFEEAPHTGYTPIIGVVSRYSEATVGAVRLRYAGATYDVLDALQEACGGALVTAVIPVTNETDLMSIPRLFAPGRIAALVVPGTHWNDVDPAAYGEKNTFSTNVQPQHDRYEMALILWCLFVLHIPVLGICLGMQRMATAMQARLWQDLPEERGRATRNHSQWDLTSHVVNIRPGTLLDQVVGEPRLETNTLHHQGVKETTLPAWLAISAYANDGVTEAIELRPEWKERWGLPPNLFALGTQWHPEIHPSELGRRLFKAFVDDTLACWTD